jgi:hypothetical protein
MAICPKKMEMFLSAEDYRQVLMTKPCWARSKPAGLFSQAAEEGLKVIEVILDHPLV